MPTFSNDPSYYGPQLPGVDVIYTGDQIVVPGYLHNAPNSTGWDIAENRMRALTPGTFFDDFVVGLNRIGTDRVGRDGNPTWAQAYAATDQEMFRGYLPGGNNPQNLLGPIGEFLDWENLKKLAPLALLAATFFLKGRR